MSYRLRVVFGCLALAGCRSAAEAQGSRQSDCGRQVDRAQLARIDSLFDNARGLVDACPDVMATTLAALWREPGVQPVRAIHLRAVSTLLRDQRLAEAIESVVRDPSLPIETRIEGLSPLSYYLRPGRWVEFTFLKEPPDSASLRMFLGEMENSLIRDGGQPIAAGYEDRLRATLEALQSDSSGAIRNGARRFLLLLDHFRQQPPAL
jgi:hypothetical protein